jgi:hypothetical protein
VIITEKKKREGWFETEEGRLARYHTEASAVIHNEIVDLVWWGQASKYAFKIEDALKRKGLLR